MAEVVLVNEEGFAIIVRESGETITVGEENEMMNCVRFHPSGGIIAANDHAVTLWGAESAKENKEEKEKKEQKLKHGSVVAMSVHPCGDFLLTAASNTSWQFYDVAHSFNLVCVGGGLSKYDHVEFHGDGMTFFTGTSHDGIMHLWDLRTPTFPSLTFNAFPWNLQAIVGLRCSPDGRHVASAHAQGCVKIWDIRTLTNPCTFCPIFDTTQEKEDVLIGLDYDATGASLAIASQRTLFVFDAEPLWTLRSRLFRPCLLSALRWNPCLSLMSLSAQGRVDFLKL